MSMIEPTEASEIKAPGKKRGPKKGSRRMPRTEKPVKAADPYAGMTVKDCCHDCNADACVISGKPYCAHPRKGGLHPEDMNDAAALRRRKEAEAKLRNQMLSAG